MPSPRRRPSRKRNVGPFFGLELRAYLRRGEFNEYEFLRPVVEDALCFTDDARLRRVYRDTFGLPDDQPIPNIPTDLLLHEALQVPLPEIHRARETGRWESILLSRYGGGAGTFRDHLELWWVKSNGDLGEIRLFLCLNDLPPASLAALDAFVDKFFARLGSTPGALYGRGKYYEMLLARTCFMGGIGHHECFSTDCLMQRAVEDLAPNLETHVPSTHFANFLSAKHVERLGRDNLCRELSEFDAAKAPPPQHRWFTYSNGSMCIIDRCFGPRVGEDIRGGGLALRMDDYFCTWLQCRFATSRLLLYQDSRVMEVIAQRLRGLREEAPPVSMLPPAPRRPDESAFTTFMERLWQSPPACIRAGAQPLTKARRHGVQRSRGGHGCHLTGFRIAQPGSDKPISIWGHPGYPLLDPLYLGGPTPKTAVAVIDSSRHGWDGEQGSRQWPRTGTPESFHCQRCGHDRFHVVALFEYGDPEDYEDPRVAERPEDFFSWIQVEATCDQCGRKTEVASIECA